jgi:hypothetical protein
MTEKQSENSIRSSHDFSFRLIPNTLFHCRRFPFSFLRPSISTAAQRLISSIALNLKKKKRAKFHATLISQFPSNLKPSKSNDSVSNFHLLQNQFFIYLADELSILVLLNGVE